MNKHLNNWLDEQEGLPPETSNTNINNEKAARSDNLGLQTIEALRKINPAKNKCPYCKDDDTDEILSNGLCSYHNYFYGSNN